MSHVRCSRCGKRVSNEVPGELIVRAFVECPECIEEQAEVPRTFTGTDMDEQDVMVTVYEDRAELARREAPGSRFERWGPPVELREERQ